ncbi:Kinesin-like protein [Dirofilaria immitis]
MEEEGKVKVAVRVRPFNKRERDLNTKCIVSTIDDQTILRHPIDEKQPKSFAYDHSFNSFDPNSNDFIDQNEVFERVGTAVLVNAFAGYNACIFAYGQTGSGKSYTMMGTAENPGIIPRLCCSIFQKINDLSSDSLAFKVEVSYLEIYNEKVRDLLDPKKTNKNLKVREHKVLGPMVDGLSVLAVSSFEQITSLMEEGNKSRTVAATNMNTESSRSHAVFNIRLTQALTDTENGFTGEKMSKISLVDLAGSERVQKTGAVGKRLEEGGNINKSLTTLGMVISALAERSHANGMSKPKFIPYRDSVLTWLLKDSLGGNSRTVMIATVSPAADNYEETLSTLRYADRATKIVNHAVINEDPNAKVIRELREEVETLRAQISQTVKEQNETEELRERLAESERLVELMNKSWDERLKDTEVVYRERQKDLAEIGISVAGSGIKVEKDRFYLVNLNADPSLNELLVYYINHQAVIGSAEQQQGTKGSNEKIDFILQGLGVQHRHALLEIVEDDCQQRLFIEQLDDKARICVNGHLITERTLLRNGYRLLIGNNHFFRVNCPKEAIDINASIMEESNAMLFDYYDAWQEVNSGLNANPITTAVDQYMEQITKKHEEEKQAALEQQYEAFEKYIQGLTQSFTPSTPTPNFGYLTPIGTPSCQFPPVGFPINPKASMRSKFFNWAQHREEMFKKNLVRLKSDIVRANALAREANMITAELSSSRCTVTYDVTLQIPAANLRPSKIKEGGFVCEPFIVVKRAGIDGYQLWSTGQLENKLIDMREMYNAKITGFERNDASTSEQLMENNHFALEDGFNINECHSPVVENVFDSQEHHSLIGVANVFLEVLLHDMRLDYQVPIISQQGEVSGRLHVEVYRLSEMDDSGIVSSLDSLDSNRTLDPQSIGATFLGKTIKCRVRIKKALNLPSSLSHFVFCQYSFFNISEILVVAPIFDPNAVRSDHGNIPCNSNFQFDHEKDFYVVVTEEFLEYIQEDALSIEIWGHRSSGFGNDFVPSTIANDIIDVEQSYKSLQERWSEVTRRIELHVNIKEMNDNGEYVSVEVRPSNEVLTGGIYQLKQGQQRRIHVKASPILDHGNLPLAFAQITSVSIGCICTRNSAMQKPLDSYQEEDLERIRQQWTTALANRQNYLVSHINALSAKGDKKTEPEKEREQSLINQWVALTEERNAISVPAANSDIPGSPAEWSPPLGTERHIPVLFLDLNSDDVTEEIPSDDGSIRVAGLQSFLSNENCGQIIMLPILEHEVNEISATCSWDSSIHENPALNKPTDGSDHIYAIVKVTVRLSHPCEIDIILRKRICVHVYKKTGLTERLIKKLVGSDSVIGTSVYYDVVAHIPKSSLDVEDRKSLARMAAHHYANNDDDLSINANGDHKETYIEAYTKSIQVVESMLKLDRLRQEVAINNMLSRQERLNRMNYFANALPNYRMKRTASLPNTAVKTPLLSANGSTAIGNVIQRKQYQVTDTGAKMARSQNSTDLSISSSSSSSMATNLISPAMEISKLSGIDEEQQCLMNMSKSSTIPETMHTSFASAYDSHLRVNTYGFQRHLQEMIRLQAANVDGNGNTPLLSVATIGEQQSTSIDSLPSMELHSLSTNGMMYSSASDSGCMIESGSSTATVDDEQKVLVNDIGIAGNNNNNNSNNNNNNNNNNYSNSVNKTLSEYVRTGIALDLNVLEL